MIGARKLVHLPNEDCPQGTSPGHRLMGNESTRLFGQNQDYKAIHNSDVWPYSLRISRLIRAKRRRLEHSVHVCPVAGDIIAVRNRKRFCLCLILSICLGFEYDFFPPTNSLGLKPIVKLITTWKQT